MSVLCGSWTRPTVSICWHDIPLKSWSLQGEYKKKARLEEVPNGNEGRRRDSERLRVPSPGEHSRDSGRTLRLGEGDEAPSEEALFGDRELADVRPSAPVLEGDGGGTGLPRVALSESSSD